MSPLFTYNPLLRPSLCVYTNTIDDLLSQLHSDEFTNDYKRLHFIPICKIPNSSILSSGWPTSFLNFFPTGVRLGGWV